MSALIVRFSAGKRIDPVIFGMPAVALDPVPVDPVRSRGLDELLPKIGILHWLSVRSLPAVLPPLVDPARDPVADILAVGVKLDPARAFQRLQSLDRGEQF